MEEIKKADFFTTIVLLDMDNCQYKVRFCVIGEKVGNDRRRCVAQGCSSEAVKPVYRFFASRTRILGIERLDDKKVFSVESDVGILINRSQKIRRQVVSEANKKLNRWPRALSEIEIKSPEFQPDGRLSLDERLILCDNCVSLRQTILEKELMEGVEGRT